MDAHLRLLLLVVVAVVAAAPASPSWSSPSSSLNLNSVPDGNLALASVGNPKWNVGAYFCTNEVLYTAVHNSLQGFTAATVNVDLIQSNIKGALKSHFEESGGVWMVSASSYHRVTGYVDDRASHVQTFCAINADELNVHVVVVKIL